MIHLWLSGGNANYYDSDYRPRVWLKYLANPMTPNSIKPYFIDADIRQPFPCFCQYLKLHFWAYDHPSFRYRKPNKSLASNHIMGQRLSTASSSTENSIQVGNDTLLAIFSRGSNPHLSEADWSKRRSNSPKPCPACNPNPCSCNQGNQAPVHIRGGDEQTSQVPVGCTLEKCC
jgi:hypothetical protein